MKTARKINAGEIRLICLFVIIISCSSIVLGQEEPVGPTKPVVVVNTPANPVPVTGIVRNAENPARQAFQIEYHPRILDPTRTTPQSKIFVIEYISGELQVDTPAGEPTLCRIFRLGFTSSPSPFSNLQIPPAAFSVIPIFQGDANSLGFIRSFYSISQTVKIYMAPGTVVGTGFSHIGPVCVSSSLNGRITLSGHLVDLAP
jgi:hypothetical protein